MRTGFIVITEIHTKTSIERWYYGTWQNGSDARKIALRLGNKWPICHCVIPATEAEIWGVRNLPI